MRLVPLSFLIGKNEATTSSPYFSFAYRETDGLHDSVHTPSTSKHLTCYILFSLHNNQSVKMTVCHKGHYVSNYFLPGAGTPLKHAISPRATPCVLCHTKCCLMHVLVASHCAVLSLATSNIYIYIIFFFVLLFPSKT